MSMSGQQSTAPRSSSGEPIVWAPQEGPQYALTECPVYEIFYGGARGGGKTDGTLGKYGLKAERWGSAFNALFFRRELPMLDDAIERSHEIYKPLGAQWYEQKKTWRFPGGGRLRFRPLEKLRDADKYQGQNISDVCIEEAGTYPDPAPIDRLHGVLRSAGGVPVQMVLTGNPGGVGQLWIKARYIDPAPMGMKVLERKLPNGKTVRYIYIPSRLQNNRKLLDADPEYINRLYLVGNPELVKAWLDGDFNAIQGAFFPEFSMANHVIKYFEIPREWARICAGDWGSAKPFAFGWFAIAQDHDHIPNGALVQYREWYGIRKNSLGEFIPNEGIKLTAEEVGKGIIQRETSKSSGREEFVRRVLDPSAFAEDGGPSIAERMNAGFVRADNKRVAKKGAMGGWDQVRARLKGEILSNYGDGELEYGKPMLYFMDNCTHSIRTLPVMQHSDNNPEDMDTEGEDHAPDMIRYGCMSRPWTPKIPEREAKIIPFAGDSWLNAGRETKRKGPRYR